MMALCTKSRSHGFSRSTIRMALVRACQGFGNTIDFDLNLVVPDASKSLDEGAIEPWTKPRYKALLQDMKKWARSQEIPTNVAWRHLTAEQRKLILEGDPENDFDGVKGFFHVAGAQEVQIARARFS